MLTQHLEINVNVQDDKTNRNAAKCVFRECVLDQHLGDKYKVDAQREKRKDPVPSLKEFIIYGLKQYSVNNDL